ncbi:MAG TPA: LamG-like jellyroll fold domain-containing protein, partial [Roseimicrobium sp.]|nr:LamG-like jellyroll fold domain-containing protein [Roseimicrobium sp.]
ASDGKGLWKSSDGGITWAQVTSFPNAGNWVPSGSSLTLGVVWVAFDKRTGTTGNATQTIYVGVADTDNAIYVSNNGGTSWSRMAGQPTGFLCLRGIVEPTLGYLYTVWNNGAGPFDGGAGDIWKYEITTATWTRITPVEPSGWGYGCIGIDRSNPLILMVGTQSAYYPDGSLWRSVDGGATWSKSWEYSNYPTKSYRAVMDVSAAPWVSDPGTKEAPYENINLGAAISGIAIDPFNSNNVFICGGWTGIWRSTNLTNWVPGGSGSCTLTIGARGIQGNAVTDMISPPSGAPLLTTMLDLGGFRNVDLTVVPSTRHNLLSSDNSSLDFAENNPNQIVRVGRGGAGNGDPGRCIAISNDNGISWTEPNQPANTLRGGTVASSCSGTTNLVWAPEGDVSIPVSYSTNGGNSWSSSTGIPAGAQVRADRVTPGKFYGFLFGKFYVSTNQGADFTLTASGLPTWGDMRPVFGQAGHIWLAGRLDGLWHSTDSGSTWTKLPNVAEVSNVGFGKAAPGQSYPAIYIGGRIGSVYGIYRSDNGGANWARMTDSTHQYGWCNGITGDRNIYGRCYATTGFGGVIYPTSTAADPVDTGPSLQTLLLFNEASGTTAADSTVNGRHGTLVNGPTRVPGKGGNAVDLDGTDDHVSLPTGVVSTLSDFTISTWVNLDAASSWSRIFDFGSGSTNYMFLSPANGATGTVRFAITTSGGGGEQQINGTSALPTGAWTHVAVTRSGNLGILYVNGVEVGRNAALTLTPASLGATTQNWIGRSQYPDPYLNGRVDDFRIYGNALAASDVLALFNGTAGALAGPWASQDIGSVGLPGSSGSPGNDIYVTASGGDIWGGSDQCHYVSRTWTGDGTLTARVNGVAKADVWTKAGLMFRESLDANARNAFIFRLPNNDINFQTRSSTGGDTAASSVPGTAAPYWLKLQRTGNVFTPYHSVDGIKWTQSGTPVTLALPTTCYVGFAATAHNNTLITGAQFDNVSLVNQGPPVPTGLSATAGNGQVALNWTWNSASGATSYTVQRSASSGGPYTTLATTVAGASYTDTGLANGATWYYTVAAQGPSGIGTASAPVAATTYTAKEIWRLAKFGTVANSGNAADSADPDGDGLTNAQEFMAGTDPINAASNAPNVNVNTVGTLNGNNKTILEATGNSLTSATFASNIATAFANNTGGVWNFDGAAFTVTSGQTITLKYGTALTNSLVLAMTEGAGATGINQASIAGEPTSGNFELGLGSNAATRTFTPDKPLLTVGIFNTDRNAAGNIPVLTVTYQDNTTASTSGANADNVYFHGLSGTVAN